MILHKVLALQIDITEPRQKFVEFKDSLTSILIDVRHILNCFESVKLLKYPDNKDDFFKNYFVEEKTSYISQIKDGEVDIYSIILNLPRLKSLLTNLNEESLSLEIDHTTKGILNIKESSINGSNFSQIFCNFIDSSEKNILKLLQSLEAFEGTDSYKKIGHFKNKDYTTTLANFQNALESFAYIGIDNALQALKAGFSNELATQIEFELTAMHDCPFYKKIHLAPRNQSLKSIKQQQQPKFVTEISVLTPPNETDSFEQLCNEITAFCKIIIASDYDVWLSILSQKLKALEQFNLERNYSNYKTMLDEQINLIARKKNERNDFL